MVGQYIVEDMLPLNIVDLPSFRAIINVDVSLSQTRRSLAVCYGRPTVPKRLNLRACTDVKNERVQTFIFYVCTRSFFTSVHVFTSVHGRF